MNRHEKVKTAAEVQEIEYVKSTRHLNEYVKGAWGVLEPATLLRWNWHLDYACEHLEAVKTRQIKRLILNVPPRSLKSTIGTVCFPTWTWIGEPSHCFLFTSYSQTLSTKHSVDRRTLITSNWYQAAWGSRFNLKEDQNEKMRFDNDKRGHMIATSMGGSATGDGGDTLVIDDPHDTTIANSKAKLQTSLENFDQKFSSRLNDKETGAIIIIMQRLHELDLTGHVIAKELGYTHVKIPAIAEERQRLVFPVSGKVVEREVGDILHPKRESEDILAVQKKTMGARVFAGQYQQRPAPEDGEIVNRNWWKYYDRMPETFDLVVQAWDLTFTDSKTSDFVVGQVWGKRNADCYLLDQVRGRFSFTRTLELFEMFSKKWPQARSKYVERAANGYALIDTLTKKIPGIIAIAPEGSKIARANAVSPIIESGNVYLPSPSSSLWINDFTEEWAVFPNGANDDQVDASCYGISKLIEKRSVDFLPVSIVGANTFKY